MISRDLPKSWSPATPFIHAGADGQPFIQGWRCVNCRAPYLCERIACARCCSTDGFVSFVAATAGTVHTYTVVHRSYPNVAVPFVSAVVDLDDGLTLKGNLCDIPMSPETRIAGSRVRLFFAAAHGAKTPDGTAYLAYFFSPCELSP